MTDEKRQRGEVCYFTARATWKQVKSVSTRLGAQGHGFSLES